MILLLVAFWFFFMRQQMGGNNKVMNFGKAHARTVTDDKNRVTFAQVAGADEESIRLIHGATELIDLIAGCKGDVCILPTYTAMLPLRAELASRCGRKEFWK